MRHFLALTLILFTTTVAFAQPPAAAPARVKTAPLESSLAAPTQSFVGTLYFDRMSQLSAEVSGRVDQILFREGDQVNTGQVLVQLNTDFIDKELMRIQSMIDLTQAQLDHSKKDLARYQQLLEQQATSATAYDQLFYSVAEIKAQKAAYTAELELTQIKKNKSAILAPFSGRILEKKIDIGNWVTTGSPIARIGALSDIFIQVPTSETLLPFSTIGQQVDVWLPATNQHLKGTHKGFRPVVDAQTKNIYSRIQLEQVALPFENMSAEVSLPTNNESEQLLVPRDALVTFNGQQFVYSIKEGKAAIIPIEIVSYSGDQVAIKSPYLQAGMPIVIEGNERLRPDQPVTVIGD